MIFSFILLFISYYRCKIACLERKNRQHWQSIHRGWEWIRKDLRSRLRTRWIQIYVGGEKNSAGRSDGGGLPGIDTGAPPEFSRRVEPIGQGTVDGPGDPGVGAKERCFAAGFRNAEVCGDGELGKE